MIYFLGIISSILLLIFILFIIGSLISISLKFLINFKLSFKKLIIPSVLIFITLILFFINSYFIINNISTQGILTTLMRIVFNNLSFDILLNEIIIPLCITLVFCILLHSFCIYSYNINYNKIKAKLFKTTNYYDNNIDNNNNVKTNDNIINTTNTNATSFEYKLDIQETQNINIIKNDSNTLTNTDLKNELAIIEDNKISFTKCLLAAFILAIIVLLFIFIFFSIGILIPTYYEIPFLK